MILNRSLVLFTAAFTAAVCFGQTPPKISVEREDLRVLEVIAPPHVKGKMHEHKIDRVMIYRVAGAEKFTYSDGRPEKTLKFAEKQVLWSPKEGMHAGEVLSANPLDIIEIELLKPRTGKKITTALDPLKTDPKHYKVEFENDQVRVVRVKFGPNESTPMHEHQLDRTTVYLTDAEVRVTDAEGKVTLTPRKAGDVVPGGAAKHREENTTGKPVEALMVELK